MWDSLWWRRIHTSRGCASSWRRVWAGRPKSRRPWSGYWRARRCNCRSRRDRRRRRRLGAADPTGLFHRQLVSKQFGEGERAGGSVVLTEQVEPLDRRQDALGDRVAGLRGDQQLAVMRVGDVADVDLDSGHPGQPEQIPGPAMGAAIPQTGARHHFSLNEVGEIAADG